MADRAFHRVLEGKQLLGYAAPSKDLATMWTIYGPDRKRVARIAPSPETEGRFQVMLEDKEGLEYVEARSFESAVSRVFGLPSHLRFDPPLPKSS